MSDATLNFPFFFLFFRKEQKQKKQLKLELEASQAAAVVCEQKCGGETDQLTQDSGKLELKAVICSVWKNVTRAANGRKASCVIQPVTFTGFSFMEL